MSVIQKQNSKMYFLVNKTKINKSNINNETRDLILEFSFMETL